MAKSTHTPEHVRFVSEILIEHPDARTDGFPAALRALRGRLGCEDEDFPAIHFRPDAFRLNEEAREIEIYEVEITHPVPANKLTHLGEWWAAWDAEDEHDWLPVLYTVNRDGVRTRRDLAVAYFELSLLPRLQEIAA